jgi:hypothetical protein
MAQSSENTKLDAASTEKVAKGDSGDHGAVAKQSLEKMQKDSSYENNVKLGPNVSSILSQLDPSSPESTKKAESALDSKVSGLLPKDDQNLLKSMNHAIVEGDSKALGAAIASMKDDPAKLKSYVDELQKNLNQADAGVNVTVTKDGNVVVYKQDDTAGVQYDGKTGAASVVPLEHQDGNVILGQGEVLNKTPEDVSKDIGLSAREGILGLSLKFPTLFPTEPPFPSQQIPGSGQPFPDWPGPGHPLPPDGNPRPDPLPPDFRPDYPRPGFPSPDQQGGSPDGPTSDNGKPHETFLPVFPKPTHRPDVDKNHTAYKPDPAWLVHNPLSAPKVDPRKITNTTSNRKPDPIETLEKTERS